MIAAAAALAAGCSAQGARQGNRGDGGNTPLANIGDGTCSTADPTCPVVCVKTGFGECEGEPTDPCEKNGIGCGVIEPCIKNGTGCEEIDPCLKHNSDCEPDPCVLTGEGCEPPPPECPKHLGDECEPPPPPPPGDGCTLTQGYWKNHPDDWPVESLTIGGTTYFKAALIALLDTPPAGGNAVLILLHQYIAAALNVASGADSSAIEETATLALAWLANHFELDGMGQPSFAHTSTAEGMVAVLLAETLDEYNNGEIGPGHCEDGEEEECVGENCGENGEEEECVGYHCDGKDRCKDHRHRWFFFHRR